MQDNNMWNPVIDGAFLPDYPENLAKIRPPYPTMIVDMLEEGAYLRQLALFSTYM